MHEVLERSCIIVLRYNSHCLFQCH